MFLICWSKGGEVADKYRSKMIGRTCVMKHRKASVRWFIQSKGQMGRDDFAPNKPVPCGVTHKQLGCVGHPLVLRMLTFPIGNTNFDVPVSKSISLYLALGLSIFTRASRCHVTQRFCIELAHSTNCTNQLVSV